MGSGTSLQRTRWASPAPPPGAESGRAGGAVGTPGVRECAAPSCGRPGRGSRRSADRRWRHEAGVGPPWRLRRPHILAVLGPAWLSPLPPGRRSAETPVCVWSVRGRSRAGRGQGQGPDRSAGVGQAAGPPSSYAVPAAAPQASAIKAAEMRDPAPSGFPGWRGGW